MEYNFETNYTTITDDGRAKYYSVNGILHRTDGPAIEYNHGGKEWYINGLLHRTDGPAIVTHENDQYYYNAGELHRIGGPAIIRHDGSTENWENGIKID